MSDKSLKERTEEPTQHRRAEALRQGKVPRSRDLNVSLGLVAAALTLWWSLSAARDGLIDVTRAGLGNLNALASGLTLDSISAPTAALATRLLPVLAPICAACCILTVICWLWQGRGVMVWSMLAPDFTRLDPVRGFSRLLHLRSGARAVFGMAKTACIAWLLWRCAHMVLGGSNSSSVASGAFVRTSTQTLAAGASRLCLQAALLLVVLGALDYALEHWLHVRELRMSRDELIQEIVELEGNVEVKRQRRWLRRLWAAPSSSGTEQDRG